MLIFTEGFLLVSIAPLIMYGFGVLAGMPIKWLFLATFLGFLVLIPVMWFGSNPNGAMFHTPLPSNHRAGQGYAWLIGINVVLTLLRWYFDQTNFAKRKYPVDKVPKDKV